MIAKTVMEVPEVTFRAETMVPLPSAAVSTLRLLAARGLMLIALEVAEVRPEAEKVSVTVPELVAKRPLKLATPPETIAVCGVVVAFKLPPLVSAAVTVVPSELTMLP